LGVCYRPKLKDFCRDASSGTVTMARPLGLEILPMNARRFVVLFLMMSLGTIWLRGERGGVLSDEVKTTNNIASAQAPIQALFNDQVAKLASDDPAVMTTAVETIVGEVLV